MVAVTISREHGALGTEIGRRVAERLGGRYLDRELIEMAFRYIGLPTPTEEPTPGARREAASLGRRIVDAITGPLSWGMAPGLRHVDTGYGEMGESSPIRQAAGSDEAYVVLMSQVMERVVEENPNSVLVGRGGQCVLAGKPGVLHVHICATLSDRIERVAAAEGLGRQEAAERVRAQDAGRAHYIRHYYGADWLEPSLYHLTVSTSGFTVDEAVELILSAAKMIAARA
ncbi:MAG: AAA family ATPase [Anaerolineae bacterium]|jgi:cytidylate kinase